MQKPYGATLIKIVFYYYFMTFKHKNHSWSLVVTRGHSWSLVVTRGHSWSLVVTRGHSWSLVVIRGHSWSLVCTFRQDLMVLEFAYLESLGYFKTLCNIFCY